MTFQSRKEWSWKIYMIDYDELGGRGTKPNSIVFLQITTHSEILLINPLLKNVNYVKAKTKSKLDWQELRLSNRLLQWFRPEMTVLSLGLRGEMQNLETDHICMEVKEELKLSTLRKPNTIRNVVINDWPKNV